MSNIHPGAHIHPTAIIHDGARIGADVSIGPYCVLGAEVVLAEGVELASHVVVAGVTRIGARTRVLPFASLGHAPQDLKFAGERTELHIGEDNVIREHVTMNPGTAGGGGLTRVGNKCLIMVGAHIAHDCQVGDGVIMVNNSTIAGHVVVHDHAVLGGLCAVHQFVRIGTLAMVGGMSGVERDVIPFGTVKGNRASLDGLNIVGMKRAGFTKAQLHEVRAAQKMIFESDEGALTDRAAQAGEAFSENLAVQQISAFMAAETSRKYCMPKV